MNLLRRTVVLVSVSVSFGWLLAAGSWSQQLPGQEGKKEGQLPPGKEGKKDVQPLPGKEGKKETQSLPKFKKIDLPQSALFYRSPRTQILLQSGGPTSATFGMVVGGVAPSKEPPTFEFAGYEVVGAEIAFAGSPNRYKGWYLSATGAKNLPQHIFVSNEVNKRNPSGGHPVGFWEVNPQTRQPGWQYKYDGLRLPYRGQPFPENPK